MTYVVVVVGLVGLILLHELGHFAVARAVGMRPRGFYLFFGPLLAKVRRNGIEYGIRAIPLGGYVRIPGMHRPAAYDVQLLMEPAIAEQGSLAPAALAVRRPLAAGDFAAARAAYPELEDEVSRATLSSSARRGAERALREVEEGTAPDAYWRAATWKRVAVIAAGPIANVLVAFLILFVMFASSGAPTSRGTNIVAQVFAGTPAAHAGLRAGDRVVAVDHTPATTFSSISRLIRSSDGAPITVTVLRNGRQLTLGPERTRHENGRWLWGFASAERLAREPVGAAAAKAGSDLGQVVTQTVSAIGSLVHRRSGAHLTSVIGITRAGAAALKVGVTYYLELLALVSMSLALMNLLPLLPLDGGHILFSLVEAIRRRAIAREVYERVSVVGFALIMLLMVIAFSSGNSPQ
jgi:regulator of sigma E protease